MRSTVDHAVHQYQPGTRRPFGVLEWPAMLRLAGPPRSGLARLAGHCIPEIITTTGRLMEVGPAWDMLWRAGRPGMCSRAMAGSPPGGVPGQRGTARVCAWACAGQGMTWSPCCRSRRAGTAASRVLEWAAKDCSDYCDALVDPERAEGVPPLEQIWAAVAAAGELRPRLSEPRAPRCGPAWPD